MKSKVAGIPCTISITDRGTAPDRSATDSDWDYNGCYPQWEVCDRRGRKADWLEAKMTDADISRIDREVLDFLEEESCP